MGEPRVVVLPSRRFFQPFFTLAPLSRDDYAQNLATGNQRNSSVDYFTGRLPNIQTHNKTEFNAVLSKLIDPFPEFIIEQADTGYRYLKIKLSGNYSHSSEGLGDGIISLMFIADALYDSPIGSLPHRTNRRTLHKSRKEAGSSLWQPRGILIQNPDQFLGSRSGVVLH
jgi:hypothetical protein